MIHDSLVDTVKDALAASRMVGIQYDFWNRENTEALIDRVKNELSADREVVFADEGIRDKESFERFLKTLTESYGNLFVGNSEFKKCLECDLGSEYLVSQAMRLILNSGRFSESRPLAIVFDAYDLDPFGSKLLKSAMSWAKGSLKNVKLVVFYRHGKIEYMADHKGWAVQNLQIGRGRTMSDEEANEILGSKRAHSKTSGVLLSQYRYDILDKGRFTETPLTTEETDYYEGQYHPLYRLAVGSERGRSLGQNDGLSIQGGQDIAVIEGGAFDVCTYLLFKNPQSGAMAFYHVWPSVTDVEEIERVVGRIYEDDLNIIIDAMPDAEHRSERYRIHVMQEALDDMELSKRPPLQVIAAIGQESHVMDALYFLKALSERGIRMDVDSVQVVGMNKGRMHLNILYDRVNDEVVFSKNGEGRIYRFPGFRARYD